MSEYAFYFLDTKQKKLFRLFRDALFQHIEFIPIPEIDTNEISMILKAVLTDTPDLFWFEGKWEYAVFEGSRYIHPLYTIDSPDSLIIRRQVDEVCSAVLKAADFTSEILRIRYVYDWILSTVEYGFANGRGQTIYDALIKQKAVCKGLSKGFQFILHQMGIFSTLQEGSLDRQARHVWNIVEIEGQYYNIDISMGYDCFSFLFHGDDRTNPYRCFAVSDDHLKQTHQYRSLPWYALSCKSDYHWRI